MRPQAHLALALLLVASGAAAQMTEAPPIPVARQAPELGDGQTPPDPQPGAWLTHCTSEARAAPLACSLEQRLIIQETGLLFLTVAIHVADADATPHLTVQTPLGLYLPPGLTLQVEAGAPTTLAIAACDANGCHARTSLADPFLADLQTGRGLRLRLHTTPDQTIDVEIPLAGFTPGLAAIR